MKALLLALCLLNDGTWDWLFDAVHDTDLDHYRLDIAQSDPIIAIDVDGNPIIVGYTTPTFTFVETIPPDVPPDGMSLCAMWDSGSTIGSVIPPVDSVIYVNIRAVDLAGNVSN